MTELLLRRSHCCDGAAQTSSVALILRVASRRDALNEEPASFPHGLIQISMVVAHSPRPPPWPRNFNFTYILILFILNKTKSKRGTFVFRVQFICVLFSQHRAKQMRVSYSHRAKQMCPILTSGLKKCVLFSQG